MSSIYYKPQATNPTPIPIGYAMRHRDGDAVGFSWDKDDPRFGPEWERIPMVAPASARLPGAVASLVRCGHSIDDATKLIDDAGYDALKQELADAAEFSKPLTDPTDDRNWQLREGDPFEPAEPVKEQWELDGDGALAIYESALEIAAMYVSTHCVDGDDHAKAILGMTRPKVREATDADLAKIENIPVWLLMRMWDSYGGIDQVLGFDGEAIHAELNRRGHGDYCAV